MTAGGRRLSRRAALRAGLAGAGGAVGLGLLGCARQAQGGSAASPRPAGTAPGVTLTLALWNGWASHGGTHWKQFVQPALDQFARDNPGLQVRLVSPGGGGSFLTAILAGRGPDVFQDWSIGPYRARQAVLPLDEYLRQENINVAIWSPGQIHAMRDQQGIQFLPCYVHVTAMAVNYDILDGLGLPRPQPDWTYQEAGQLYRACAASRGTQHRYGVGMYFNGKSMGDPSSMSTYVCHFFGGSAGEADRLHCNIGNPRSYAGIDWVEHLHYDQVISPNERDGNLQQIAFVEAGTAGLPGYLNSWRDQFKWSFFPVPAFPAGRFSFEATDYYAINAETKHPDQAWRLLRWLAAEPFWSRYCVKYLLRTPSLVALWDEYAATVQAVAPFVKGRGVEYFTQAAAHWGIANTVFAYEQPRVASLLGAGLTRVYGEQATTAAAMPVAAKQVDVLEAEAAAAAAVQSKPRSFPTTGPEMAPVPTGI